MLDREAIYRQLKQDREHDCLQANRDAMIGMIDFAIAAGSFDDAKEVIEEIFTDASREGNVYAIKNTNKVFNEQEKTQKESTTKDPSEFTCIRITEEGIQLIRAGI